MIMNNSRDDVFVSSLERLRDQKNRGALAALRRGLGKRPGTELSMAPYIERFRPTPWDRPWYYLIAELFGSHPCMKAEGKPANIGYTMNCIVHAYMSDDVGEDKARKRVERRFTALLNAHPDDLPRHLIHIISLAKSKEVPVDYRRLLRDLRYWDSDTKWVQMQWAASFWGGSSPLAPGDVLDEDDESEDE